MKKSYLVLSLIVSQMLCAEEVTTDLVANFGGKGDTVTGYPSTVSKNNGTLDDATYKTDWTGSASSLNLITDNLTFTFKPTNSENNLVINNSSTSFDFTNSSSDTTAPITATIKGDSALNTLIIGNSEYSNNATNLGKNIALIIDGSFTTTNVVSKLTIAENSTLTINSTAFNNSGTITLSGDSSTLKSGTTAFNNTGIITLSGATSTVDTSSASSFTNNGGISLSGDTSTLKVNNTLTNNGVILMRDSSKIESVSTLAINTTGTPPKQGSILVQGSASISSGTSTLTITNQDIKLQNLVSKDSTDSSKTTFSQATLTLSAISSGTLTLGDTSNGVVNIMGELNKTDASLTNDQETSIGNLALNGFTTINANSVNFKNVNVTSQNTSTLDLQSGVLGLENTSITLAPTSSITAQPKSATTLTGQNTISSTGTLTITGSHDFKGNGSLDLVGSTVALGNGSAFNATGADGTPVIGVSASNEITTENFTLSNLALQAINSTITNTSMTLTNSTIEAIDSEENLADLEIKKAGSGTITITNGGSGVTFRGKNISLTEQAITISTSSTLTLQTDGGGVTLDGGTNGLSISGTNGNGTEKLNLNTPSLTLKGKVTLNNLKVSTNQDLQIVGTEGDTNKGLVFSGGTTIDTGSNVTGGTQYRSLTFTSDFIKVEGATDEKQAYVSFGANTELKASDFTFQNQNIQLTSGLSLYAYGTGVVPTSPSTYSDSGVFVMNNATFTGGTNSTVTLYSGSGGSTLLPKNLTLNKVSIASCLINGTSCSTTADNTLDLSSTEGSINILDTSTISAAKFVYGDSLTDSTKTTQGIGVDLFVGNDKSKGNLVIKSATGNGSTSGDVFILGGEVAIDLRGANGASSVGFDIEMGTTPSKLSTNTIDLTFRGGGLTVIGSGINGTNSYEFKAKSFAFEEIKDGDVVVDSPFVKVKNAQLTLNGASGMDNINLVGTVYLEGATTGDDGISKLLATKNGGGSGTAVTLKLHDIEAIGNSTIDSNILYFMESNITVSNSGNKGFLILDKNTTLTDNTLAGTINSITLNSGILSFQYNTNANASITLSADSTITSSGVSSLTLKTIKVGAAETDLYSLNVTDGTFTLQEATAGTQLGAITLGSESSQGGNFIYQNGDASQYQSIDLKGDLISYGNSSITANTFTISAKDADNSENYTISSTGGELKLIAQDSKTPALTVIANIVLDNGSLGYYGSSNTLASLSLDSSSSISSVGTSTLQSDSLDLKGASISASGGMLSLKGISSSTTAGDVYVGNGGILTLQNSNTSLATLKIDSEKSLTLSADVAYVTPDSPLGGGTFGQVKVQSLQFESKSGGLINIALNTSSTSNYADLLFALREGAVTLISTQDGIKKKETNASYTDITLSDIKTDTSDLTSITLTPYLEAGQNTQGQTISAKNLLLDLRVSQTNVTQLIESIKDATAKESMTSIVNSGNNPLILESIMQSNSNAFKVGMAEYISAGNTQVVQTALDYINGAMSSLGDSMFASNKIYELIAMLKTANVENRMTRGKNPFMAKTQLSSLIKSLVGTAYASNDDLLLEEEDSTPNYGEIWAVFDGAMSFSKEASGNSSLYGFTAGYDTLLGEKKNYLLGFYASYGYGAYSVDYVRNNSHNFGLGLYTRMSFENSEVDLIFSQTIGLNHTDVDLGASNSYVAQALKQTLAYNFYTTDIEARYGYVFKVGDEDSPYYFRPFGGINFALIVNSGARGDGEAELGIQAMNTYQLSVSVGVEMRKYFGEENYLYLLPILQKGLLNDGGGTNVGFYGNENIAITPDYNVDTTMAIYLGGTGNVAENLAINGGVGVKIGFEKKDLLTNWNVGLRYKF